MGEVYLITGPTGKRYIGATKNCAEVRFNDHLKAATRGVDCYLSRAMRKHGLENQLIIFFGTRSPTGYNATGGGRY